MRTRLASNRSSCKFTDIDMWKGRFKEATSSLLTQYGESVSFDWRLYKQDIAGSCAHARALEREGIINGRWETNDDE